jgi:hypothetical protein
MTKKQTTTTKSVAGAVSARVAKPKAPRVTSSKHKKATTGEPIAVIAEEIVVMAPSADASPLETISKLAYGYWEARGCQGGDPLADWVRAEEAYRQGLA